METQIVPFAGNPSSSTPGHWPNRYTVTSVLIIFTNVVCQVFESSPAVTIGSNLSVRMVSIGQSLYYGKTYKVALNAIGFGSLLFPYSNLVSIGLETISEVFNFYDKPTKDTPFVFKRDPSKILDPRVRENAIEILGLSEDMLTDPACVKKRYDWIVEELEKRKSKVGKVFVPAFEELIQEHHIAYETLTKVNQ